MFEVYLINFNILVGTGTSLDEAKEIAVKAGYETAIRQNGATVKKYSPISGWR